MTTRRQAGWVLVAALLVGCSGTDGEAGADVDERPCSEVIESLDDARRIRAESFGGGPEGREAMATIVGTVQQRPDCFSDEEVEFANLWAEGLPSEEETHAIEAAESACDEVGGEYSTAVPGDVVFDSPEEALAAEEALDDRMEGAAERSFEGDGRVDFEYHDEAGDYHGWVMTEEAEAGWFVRWVITCRGDTTTVEESS